MNVESQKELSTVEFWETRYAAEDAVRENSSRDYEWFKTYAKLKPFLDAHLPTTDSCPKILHLGCGTSSLTADLYHAGYRDQVSVDFSTQAISIMEHRNRDLRLDWQVMDVRDMQFPNSAFDIAIDKGTLDAMLHGSLWDPEDEVKTNVQAYVDEVYRVLRPGGRWLYVTYRQPHFLKPLLAREGTWHINVETLEDAPGAFEYFGFVMTKDVRELQTCG